MSDSMEPLDLLVMVGINIFGVYALYKISKVIYWFIKDKASKEEKF